MEEGNLAFAMIGIPLGIRAHRSEKTIGFLICCALSGAIVGLFLLVLRSAAG